MAEPLVSIVITMYRGGRYVKESILSSLTQDYENYEIILVDNNASEETKSYAYPFLDQYPDKVRLVLESNQGVCYARNAGIIAAKGEYIALLDDDDVMYSNRLYEQLHVLNKEQRIVLVTSWNDEVSPEGRITKSDSKPSEIFWAKLLLGGSEQYKAYPYLFSIPSTWMFRKNPAIKMGLFNVRFADYMEDWDFLYRIFEYGGTKVIDKSLIKYRLTSGEFEEKKYGGDGYRGIRFWLGTNQLFDHIQEYNVFNESDVPIKALRKIQSRWLREMGYLLMQYPEKHKEGERLIYRALRANITDWKAWKYFIRLYYPRFLYPKVFYKKFPEGILPQGFENDFFTLKRGSEKRVVAIRKRNETSE